MKQPVSAEATGGFRPPGRFALKNGTKIGVTRASQRTDVLAPDTGFRVENSRFSSRTQPRQSQVVPKQSYGGIRNPRFGD
jgi:hypothetical protein